MRKSLLTAKQDRQAWQEETAMWMGASVSPCTAERSQFWPVRLDTDHFMFYFLPDNPFAPAFRLTCTLSSTLLLCCKCSSILSFLSNPFWDKFFNISTKYNKVRNISLHLLKNRFFPCLTNVYFSSWVVMTSNTLCPISNYSCQLNGICIKKKSF